MSAGLDHVTLCGIGKNPYHYHLVTIALVGNCHNGVTVFLIAEFDFSINPVMVAIAGNTALSVIVCCRLLSKTPPICR